MPLHNQSGPSHESPWALLVPNLPEPPPKSGEKKNMRHSFTKSLGYSAFASSKTSMFQPGHTLKESFIQKLSPALNWRSQKLWRNQTEVNISFLQWGPPLGLKKLPDWLCSGSLVSSEVGVLSGPNIGKKRSIKKLLSRPECKILFENRMRQLPTGHLGIS